MLAKVFSGAVVGLEGELIEVEVDIASGLPKLLICRAAGQGGAGGAASGYAPLIRNSGCVYPMRRITVNLAPADVRKEGPSFDLPIAVGIVLAAEQVLADTSPSLFLGELSLDGRLRATHGILPMVTLARDRGLTDVYVPAARRARGGARRRRATSSRSRPSRRWWRTCAATSSIEPFVRSEA